MDKKYYWIKLRTDFFGREDIDFLMSQKNGSQYVVLYQMLCLMTANTNGELVSNIGEVIVPYDINKIARNTKYFDVDTITVALELYKRLGLIYTNENNNLVITNSLSLVGSESASKEAEKKRKYREKIKQLEINNEKGTQKGTNCPIDIRDKRLDIRDKIIDNNIYNYIQKKFGRVLSPIECYLISKWEIYSKEDIKECIDKAFEMNKYSIQYINTMLYNKKNKPKEVIKNTSNDVLPSWFDKEEDIKEESLSEEEQKEMDQLMSKYQD